MFSACCTKYTIQSMHTKDKYQPSLGGNS